MVPSVAQLLSEVSPPLTHFCVDCTRPWVGAAHPLNYIGMKRQVEAEHGAFRDDMIWVARLPLEAPRIRHLAQVAWKATHIDSQPVFQGHDAVTRKVQENHRWRQGKTG